MCYTLAMDDAKKQAPKQLQPYVWKKGQSGNLVGRPPGKTFKEFAREYLMSLPDDEKVDYLASWPPDIGKWLKTILQMPRQLPAKTAAQFRSRASKSHLWNETSYRGKQPLPAVVGGRLKDACKEKGRLLELSGRTHPRRDEISISVIKVTEPKGWMLDGRTFR